jgi:hypothetical protein
LRGNRHPQPVGDQQQPVAQRFEQRAEQQHMPSFPDIGQPSARDFQQHQRRGESRFAEQEVIEAQPHPVAVIGDENGNDKAHVYADGVRL